MGLDRAPRNRAERRARGHRRHALDEVLDAFRRVGATRRLGPPTFDPRRADRSSTRRHGATRHGQARDNAALEVAAVDHGLGDALLSDRARRLVAGRTG